MIDLVHSLSRGSLSRRAFLRRSVAATGGVFALAFLGPVPVALADEPCIKDCKNISTGCYNWYGPPSCTSSRVCNSSPNQQWYGCCTCTCTDPCLCDPTYEQAKLRICSNGHCCCYCIAA